MPRTPFVAGNWKMNTTKASAVDLAKAVANGAPGRRPGRRRPALRLSRCRRPGHRRLHRAPRRAGRLLRKKRRLHRRNFRRDAQGPRREIRPRRPQRTPACARANPPNSCRAKAQAIYAGGLTLVHCVGEKLEQRDADETFDVVQPPARRTQPPPSRTPTAWSSPTNPSGPSAPAATPPTPRPRKSTPISASTSPRCGTRISPTASASNTAAA